MFKEATILDQLMKEKIQVCPAVDRLCRFFSQVLNVCAINPKFKVYRNHICVAEKIIALKDRDNEWGTKTKEEEIE